ncbi:MAG: thioredoxin [bacterium]
MNSQQPLYIDSSLEKFSQDVIEASKSQLVLVDFWAAWCGPCRSLAPILEKLVTDYAGAIKLVKVDTDKEQALATQFGVRSLPTVYFFKNEEVVDQFMGVQPESSIRSMIDKFVESALDRDLEAATLAYNDGDIDVAKDKVRELIENHGQDDRAKLLLLKWLTDEKKLEEASTIADTLSAHSRSSVESRAIFATLEFLQESQTTDEPGALAEKLKQNPDDLETRYQLANCLIVRQQFAEGMDHLIEIIRRDRKFENDAARKTMLRVFEALGGKGELVSEYRSRLSSVLF